MIEIDGSRKSGSGTIVRDAVSLSALALQDLSLTNIRAKRLPKPGLRAQHLRGIEAIADLCQGRLEGASIGARAIRFFPGRTIRGGRYAWDIGTAGSTTMLVLCVLPLALYADRPSCFHITGGLFQDFAPSVYSLQHVLLPLLKRMGAEIELRILRPGYVPQGQGRIVLDVKPLKRPLAPLNLTDPGKLLSIQGIALSSLLKERRVSDRMADECRKNLQAQGYSVSLELLYDTEESPVYEKPAAQAGAALAIWAKTDTGCLLGADCAGAPRRSSEYIGRKVARSLTEALQSGTALDVHVADQIIPFAALAEGWSSFSIPEVTDHIESRLWLVETFLGAKTELSNSTLRIRGIGYRKNPA
ncbi:RNA 3'-terminal phosphate cyclase (ATP) [Syntrophus gentianae]|uniref:RNA 3'-terminal phosphate cyclase n=1 Tax=Syntrophus gentianae TaxID=43775 RepID=A0A1H7V9C6_9BACT|nr:RNA 3'-terminal phosphate cyclase [Syntrophus gentianae]SEM05357.1 RNA 3'-terminal phosphate cyclase (ATP) [Syntrophus gentianae]